MTNARLKKLEIRLAIEKRQEELLEAIDKLNTRFDRFAFMNPHNGWFSTRPGQNDIEAAARLVADVARKTSELRTAQSLAKMGRLYV